MVRDKIITNETSELLLSHVLDFYDNDEYMLNIFKVIGQEIEELIRWVNDFENQPYPQFATFTLPYWEESLGLETDASMSVEKRRSMIITKLSTYFPITRQRLESIASSVSGAPISIKDFVADYTFGIEIGLSESVDLQALIDEVNETKPAHLSYLIAQRLNSNLFIASSTLSGEEITVYPWQTDSLESKGVSYFGTNSQSIEKISTYPN